MRTVNLGTVSEGYLCAEGAMLGVSVSSSLEIRTAASTSTV